MDGTSPEIAASAQEKIQEMVRRIVERFHPEKIILFGSYAWGEPGPDSDVDLFIVKETADKPRARRLRVRDILSDRNIRMPIDLIVITPEEIQKRLSIGDVFCKMIVEEGKDLYVT